jgi:two-component system cell cycle sensor histidine kinase/response regulator CckA
MIQSFTFPERPRPARVQPGVASEPARVLVVEDEPLIAEEVRAVLEGAGYTVIGVADCMGEAIALARQHRPDLTLMDVHLRGGDCGIETAKYLCERFQTAVVLLTAFCDQALLREGRAAEPFGYLLKPFDERGLRSAVEIALYKDRTERQLREAQNRLASVLRCLGDGVLATDAEGRVIHLNPQAERLTGWRAAQARGRPLGGVFKAHDPRCDRPLGDIVQRVQRENAVLGLAPTAVLTSRDGQQRPIGGSCAPLVDEGGVTRGAVLAFRDESERRRLAAEAERAQRLESLGLIAGGIAHEFNNQLAAVLGHLEVALSPAGEARRPAALRQAVAACRTAGVTAQRLITFAKGGEPVYERLALGPVLEQALRLSRASRRGVPIERQQAPGLWPVRGDAQQLAQLFSNLALNALEALDPERGGRVRLLAANRKAPPELPPEVAAAAGGRFVQVSVEDEGRGIAEEDLARIFDPFFTTKPAGHGLGLAIAHSIVRRHGGWIAVRSQKAGGSRFDVYLPAAEGGGGPASEPPAAALATAGRPRLLVVDDEAPVREVLGRMLAAQGYQVTACAAFEEALHEYRAGLRAAQPYDLVLTDLRLERGSGIELARRLRQEHPQARLALMTGYCDQGAHARPAEFGFVAALTKPFSLGELTRAVQAALGSAIGAEGKR